jgi:hypothetical protein
MPSDRSSIVPSMGGVSRSDRHDGARAPEPGARRRGWFSDAAIEPRCEDQEAEVWAALYARPDTPQRTVRRVQPMEAARRVEWIEPAGADRAVRAEPALSSDAEIRIERAERAWDRPAA